jgi:hypothetical protein
VPYSNFDFLQGDSKGTFFYELESDFFQKIDLIGSNFMREIECAHSRTLKTFPDPDSRKSVCFEAKKIIISELESEKHFHASGMRSIDALHKITPRGVFLKEKIRTNSCKKSQKYPFLKHPVFFILKQYSRTTYC